MRNIVSVAFVLFAAIPALAAEPAKEKAVAPAAPAEVKKTVEAFDGRWSFDASLTVPGAPAPAKVKLAFECKKIALGNALSCTGKGKIPGVGELDDAFLVAYDVGGKAAHFMAVTSMGEVHDHKCQWKDDKTFLCEPLSYTMPDGKAATEEFQINWTDAKNASFKAVTTLKEGGAKITFEGTGKRK